MDALLKSVLTVDTLINVWVFIFIGLMIWLYFRKDPVTSPDDPPE